MVTLWIIFWYFLSPQDLLQHDGDTIDHFLLFLSPLELPQHDGDTMDHFLASSVTARPSTE